jgi:primosomal protein N' (replication factor Y)
MSNQHTSQRSLFESGPQWAEDDAREGIIATVVLPDGIEKPLDYLVPEALAGVVEPGRRVIVPLGRGNRERLAYCVGVRSGELPQLPLKSVAGVEDDAPLLSQRMLDLTRWMADRWMARWGEVLEAVLPAGVRLRRKTRAVPLLMATGVEPARPPTAAQARVLAAAATPATVESLAQATGSSRAVVMRLLKTGLLREAGSVDRPHGRPAAAAAVRPTIRHDRPAALASAQSAALEAILDPLRGGRHETIVLFGVTGSGKTEVYLQAVEETLSYGKQATGFVPASGAWPCCTVT